VSGWAIYPTFYDASGNPCNHEDAAQMRGLQFGWKLNGGDALASFSLIGDYHRRARWRSINPDAVELVLRSAGGTDLWRGRLLQVAASPETRTIQPTYVGYWATTTDFLYTYTYTAGSTTTLGSVIFDLTYNGFTPFLKYSASYITDPAVNFTPAGGAHLVFDHEYPRTIIQRLLQPGDGNEQFHCAVWADRYIRVFRRDLTLKWQVWSNMVRGQTASVISRANLYSSVTAPYTDSGGAAQWTTPVTDATAAAIYGSARQARISNPFQTQAIATQLAAQFLYDHKTPRDSGSGFTLGPMAYDQFGRGVPSYLIRPGDVIRIVDQAYASTNVTGAADNVGSYYIVEVAVDVEANAVTVVPDAPVASLTNLVGGAV
jgi:hypothetical protein